MTLIEYKGKIYGGMKEIAEEAFESGEPFDSVVETRFGKGSRPFAIDGYKVVIEAGKVQLWKYGPASHDPPIGNGKFLLKEREVA